MGVNEWDLARFPTPRRLMSAEQIRRWAGNGIQFGSHTRTHPDLRSIPEDALVNEVENSGTDLAQILDRPVRSFAYPFGLHDTRVRTPRLPAAMTLPSPVMTAASARRRTLIASHAPAFSRPIPALTFTFGCALAGVQFRACLRPRIPARGCEPFAHASPSPEALNVETSSSFV